MSDNLPSLWTVKRAFPPRAQAGPGPAAVDETGTSFSFIPGEELTLDSGRTETPEQDGVLLYRWLYLQNEKGSGYVPWNSEDPDDFKSFATPFVRGAIELLDFTLHEAEVPVLDFVNSAMRKSLRFKTNPAYLLAWAHIESGETWVEGKITSTPVQENELGVGTYKFRPKQWDAMVAKWGKNEHIASGNHMLAPLPQQTFAAAHSGDAVATLTEQLGRTPKFYELYMTHLFTITGAISIIEAGEADENAPISPLVEAVFEGDDNSDAILADLQSRKPTLFEDDVTFATMKTTLIADLDEGFAWVRDLADELFPAPEETAGGDFRAGAGASGKLGILSEEFESRGDPGAIGWDSTGGHSYGKYQIASQKSMLHFLDFVRDSYPTISNVLEAAGGLDAAKSGTDKFKAAWKGLVSNPNFVPAQHKFIKMTHYDKMVRNIADVIDVEDQSSAFQNVVWSVAVQHGAKHRLVANSIQPVVGKSQADLINAVYNERSKVHIYFESSEPDIQKSVANRFKKERQMALEMLAREETA